MVSFNAFRRSTWSANKPEFPSAFGHFFVTVSFVLKIE